MHVNGFINPQLIGRIFFQINLKIRFFIPRAREITKFIDIPFFHINVILCANSHYCEINIAEVLNNFSKSSRNFCGLASPFRCVKQFR